MDLGKLRDLAHHRTCRECGAEFETIAETRDQEEVPALQQFSDHLTSHQATPEQWAVAHGKIQASKGSAKDRI